MKKQIELQEGVWYKYKRDSSCILMYNKLADKSRFTFTGYWTKTFGKWRGFNTPADWNPATHEELSKLGDEWEKYPWVEYEEPVLDMTTPKNYKYAIIKDGGYNLLVIEDLKKPGMKSVTNDIDGIVKALLCMDHPAMYDTYNLVVVYKDSEDNWDMYDFVLNKFVLMKLQSLEEVLIKWRKFIPIRYN